MSNASQKAADKIHADLEAWRNSARLHAAASANTTEVQTAFTALAEALTVAMRKAEACMSERDAKIARQG